MIDTHCHLTYSPLCDRIEEVLSKARQMNVDRMISVGTTPDDADQAIAIAHTHSAVYATAGLHPCYSDQWTDQLTLQTRLRHALQQDRVVALGEMGLDKHYPDPPLNIQQEAFQWQLDLMKETDLPGIIHNREATDQTLAILKSSGLAGDRFVFHCFTGTAQELDMILDFGAMVSFTGAVTFKNSQSLALAQQRVPLDRLMIETDSPYLTPEPFRKIRPNEPCYVSQVAQFLATHRQMLLEDFTHQTDTNAQQFFRLG